MPRHIAILLTFLSMLSASGGATFHHYVNDYQGNVAVVVKGNEVVQTNLYYPDGLPMNTSTAVAANAFKYSGKELSLHRGLPVYDYHARLTLPSVGNRFRTLDPCSESFYPISPYTYCAGDPINFIDPTGMREIEVDQNGYIKKNENSSTDRFDSVTVVDAKGNIVSSTNVGHNSVKVIQHTDKNKTTEFQVTGDTNSSQVYEALSKGDVEYALCITSPLKPNISDNQSTEETPNFITTTHQSQSDSSMVYYIKSTLKNKYKIIEYTHSHPDNTPYPSNFTENGKNVGDIPVIEKLIKEIGYNITTKIYLPKHEKYIEFDKNYKREAK